MRRAVKIGVTVTKAVQTIRPTDCPEVIQLNSLLFGIPLQKSVGLFVMFIECFFVLQIHRAP